MIDNTFLVSRKQTTTTTKRPMAAMMTLLHTMLLVLVLSLLLQQRGAFGFVSIVVQHPQSQQQYHGGTIITSFLSKNDKATTTTTKIIDRERKIVGTTITTSTRRAFPLLAAKKEPTTKSNKKETSTTKKGKKKTSTVKKDKEEEEDIYVPLEEYDEHAAKVFHLIDEDGNGRIDQDELREVLKLLNIDASDDDVSALFKHLDLDQNLEIEFDEFLSWYVNAAQIAQKETNVVLEALKNRRTVNEFDTSSNVPESVVKQAIDAAIYAPNHKLTEPWNFILLGPKSIKDIAILNSSSISDPIKAKAKQKRWENIPGWCVVTSRKSPTNDTLQEDEDYAATCCAIHNFCLALWVEGVGTKWTTGPVTRTEEFASICDIDLSSEKVVGCIWYGYAKGGLASIKIPKRKRTVDDVTRTRP